MGRILSTLSSHPARASGAKISLESLIPGKEPPRQSDGWNRVSLVIAPVSIPNPSGPYAR